MSSSLDSLKKKAAQEEKEGERRSRSEDKSVASASKITEPHTVYAGKGCAEIEPLDKSRKRGSGSNPMAPLSLQPQSGGKPSPGNGENKTSTKVELDDLPNAELSQDVRSEQHQSTSSVEQPVFHAGTGYNPDNRRLQWAVLGILSALVVLSFSVFYYFTVTPMIRDIPSLTVAGDVEGMDVSVPAQQKMPGGNMAGGTLVADLESSGAPVVEEAQPYVEEVTPKDMIVAMQGHDVAVVSAESPGLAAHMEEQPVMLKEGVAEIPEVLPENEDMVATISEALPEENMAAAGSPVAAEDVAVIPGMFTLSKKKTVSPVGAQLREAFDAYKKGNYSRAKTLYQRVVSDSSNNRNGLLGLAAIAMREGDIGRAYNYYSYLLKLDPLDEVAMVAMIDLSGKNNFRQSESTVKSLLSHDAELPYLHFALGNIYASESRWPEAQQAFFTAYRLKPNESNYALNLAISLDNIGQYETALNYYDIAIKLAGGSDAQFDVASVLTRMQAISDIKHP